MHLKHKNFALKCVIFASNFQKFSVEGAQPPSQTHSLSFRPPYSQFLDTPLLTLQSFRDDKPLALEDFELKSGKNRINNISRKTIKSLSCLTRDEPAYKNIALSK